MYEDALILQIRPRRPLDLSKQLSIIEIHSVHVPV